MKSKKLAFSIVLGVCALVCSSAFALGGEDVKTYAQGEETQAVTELNLFHQEYTTITSAAYPTPDSEYFAKLESIKLGKGENEASYANVLQVLVKGPFEIEGLGSYFSALTYDISDYDLPYFSVTVGNANCNADPVTNEVNFTNEILYRVMVDGEEIARSTHALKAYETERITCEIPEGAAEIRLHAQSELGEAHGECNWANPVLKSTAFDPLETTKLIDRPVSGYSDNAAHEAYEVKRATLAQGTDKALTDDNAITGAIHGDYGNNTWKFSADYDISDKNYNRLTVDAGMLFGETFNQVRFKIMAIGGTHGDLGISPIMDGTEYYHFDVEIPSGTTKIQFWAQSVTNAKEYGNLAWCNATLYTGGKPNLKVLGEVTSAEEELAWGGELPALKANVTVEKATVAGEISLDQDQTLEYGEHEYTWTFMPADKNAFDVLTGTITLTAGKGTFDLSGVSFTDKTYDYDGTVKSVLIDGAENLPEFIVVSYSDNELTVPGETVAIVSFTVTGENAEKYHDIPSLSAILKVNPSEPITAENATKTYTQGSAEDLSFTCVYAPVNVSLSMDDTPVTDEFFSIDGNTLVIKGGYLSTLTDGTYTFRFTCEGGESELTLTVVKAPDEGGDENGNGNGNENGNGNGNGNEENGDRAEDEEKGCASSIGAAFLSLVTLCGVAFLIKSKRKD